MKLTFLGTRANTEATSNRHLRHSALLVGYRRTTIIVDCGEDWEEDLMRLETDAIVLTHAHPDHAWGLKGGAPGPVFATEATWKDLTSFPIEQKYWVYSRDPFEIGELTFEAFSVDHSTRCPAVGYRITANECSIFYVPDVVYIPDQQSALKGIRLYVGDGATVTRSMVRKIKGALVGHTPVRTQLTWCQKHQVPRALFTHCGSEIIQNEESGIDKKIKQMGEKKCVDADIAYDGLKIILR